MRRNLFLVASFVATVGAFAQHSVVSGPDGKLKLDFDLKNGKPVYSVTYDGVQMLDESPLGFVANFADFSQNLTFVKASEKHLAYDYTMDRSKFANVKVDANNLVVTLKNDKGMTYDIDFRVSNNDIAFRYVIPNQPDRAHEKKFSIRIMKECTGFDFPSSTTTFLTPQSDAMVGWKGTKPSYEEEYDYEAPMAKKSRFGHGYTFPGLFHVGGADAEATQKQGKKKVEAKPEGWVLVSETGVSSSYCGSRLSDMKGDGLYTLEFPMMEENGGNGTIEPAFALPGATPWRTITVGTSLKPIVETTVPWDYVEAQYATQNKYKYGRGTWSWIIWQDNSINYDDQVKYIGLAKAMGYEYVLVDNWWDNNIGKKRMEELVRYAKTQGVDVFLWYSSSGYWNDIEQGPINIMSNPIVRKQYMKWMKSLGVKGIKVDFFGGDKQETMRLYEAILSDADDNGLMVIFHGCTIPRGWERMYPNYVGSEAVLASENMFFGQHACDVEARDVATHPFIRNAIGCMEFGGCFLSRTINKGNDASKHGSKRVTTDCHELATTVLFQNPIQNFALAPENLNEIGKGGAPAICLDYMRNVPTTWEETVFIDGYPGKYCVLARKSGGKWYVAGNNNTGKPLTLKLNLPMVSKGDMITVYSDDLKTLEPQKKEQKAGATVAITMANQGGFVIVK
ncbi:MAG: glycoside hydrolase family 97 catalytic domain-containing protein [Bacteroidaceae bacterium]|nr:glycoside hydrolase family 97 catalytic domain-containing protein [Bacteroidaceae bacterium]